MFKKKEFLKLEKKYSSYQGEGTIGTMMKMCHKKLEDSSHLKNLKSNCKVLEIGAGSEPHLKYVEHSYKQYFFLETSKFSINLLKKNLKIIKKLYLKFIMEKRFLTNQIILIEL
jgi:hypothetical protein